METRRGTGSARGGAGGGAGSWAHCTRHSSEDSNARGLRVLSDAGAQRTLPLQRPRTAIPLFPKVVWAITIIA